MYRRKAVNLLIMITLIILFSGMISGVMRSARANSDTQTGMVIEGRVMSTYGPVKNARVKIAGESAYTLTDSEGRYKLRTRYLPGTRLKITAAKQGWFNNGIITSGPGRERNIYLNPVFLNDRANYRFISPLTCFRCHGKLTRYWDRSKMAYTTSNPKVLDMYNGTDALQRQGIAPGFRLNNPDSNGNCAVCHAPSTAAASPWSQDLNQALQPSVSEWDGVSCDYCHKVRKVIPNENKPSRMEAVLERQSSRRDPSILVFGPYADVVAPPMAASYNSLYEQGLFCATCHSHFKKLDKADRAAYDKIYTAAEQKALGIDNAEYLPVQTTYHEWKMWQDQLAADDPNKGKKCQDCHMSWRKEMLPYDNFIVDDMARNMWGTFRDPKTIHPHHFDGGTPTQLKTALALELEGEITGNRLTVKVFITNTNGGHWVPTGETMRSVMLLLNATDSAGKPLQMLSGDRLPEWTGVGKPEQGNFAGLPGAVFARILKDDRGRLHVPFWQATGIAMDTRIRPKTTVTRTYEFALADPDDEPTAEARLVYRPVVRPLAKMKSWDVKDIPITGSVW